MAHFWRKLPQDFDGMTLRQYRQLELFAAQAIKASDVTPTPVDEEVDDG